MKKFICCLSLLLVIGFVAGCGEEKLPDDLPSDEGPISLTGGAI